MRKTLNAAFIIFLMVMVVISGHTQGQPRKTQLTVLLYPYVPDYKHIRRVVESEFESRHENIDIIISEQNWDYYNASGLDKNYDIYELDTVFLADFIKAGRVRELDLTRLHIRNDSLPFCLEASQYDDKLYGVPHWVCALFLFHLKNDREVQSVTSRASLVNAIGKTPQKGRGLLLYMGEQYTLGELYVDCLFDLGLTVKETMATLETGTLYSPAVMAMKELLSLTDHGISRSEKLFNVWPPIQTHEFTHARGRALVGYSERMYYILKEIERPTEPTPVLDPANITVSIFNQGMESTTSLAWVDTFVLNSQLSKEKVDAAYKFLNFISSDALYIKKLLPHDSPPLYLLSPYEKTYTLSEFAEAAPLYPTFRKELHSVSGFTTENLDLTLRSLGGKLDAILPKSETVKK